MCLPYSMIVLLGSPLLRWRYFSDQSASASACMYIPQMRSCHEHFEDILTLYLSVDHIFEWAFTDILLNNHYVLKVSVIRHFQYTVEKWVWLNKETNCMLISTYHILENHLTVNAASSSLIPCIVVVLSFNRQFCDTSAYIGSVIIIRFAIARL